MNIFFNNKLLKSTDEILFSEDEAKHIVKVLRKKIGDEIIVTNGKGLKWRGTISSINIKNLKAIKSDAKLIPKSFENIHIAISIIKSSSRMEWFIEKATELGVNEITPIICFNTERKSLNLDRCQKIMISAVKQSKRFFIPKLNPVISLKEFLALKNKNHHTYIAHCHKGEKKLVHEIQSINNKVTVMIGPEGDFSNDEINFSINKNAIPISLGENRLRTETAGIFAISNLIIQKHILKTKY